MKFSEKVIQARKEKALTQEDLAEAVGVSRQAVSKWETDEAKPDLEKLIGICKVLDLSMDYLCLDKQPTLPTPETPQIIPNTPGKGHQVRLMALSICAALLLGIAAGALGTHLFRDAIPPQAETSGTVQETQPDYAELVEKLTITYASVDQDAGKRTICFLPGVQVEGMQVQMLIKDNLIGETTYHDVEWKDSYCILEYTVTGMHDLDLCAVFTLNEITIQLPVVKIVGTSGNHSAVYNYWSK